MIKQLEKIKKKYATPISALKAAWATVELELGCCCEPITIRGKTLVLKSSDDALSLQYKEKQIIKITESIIGFYIERIKIIT